MSVVSSIPGTPVTRFVQQRKRNKKGRRMRKASIKVFKRKRLKEKSNTITQGHELFRRGLKVTLAGKFRTPVCTTSPLPVRTQRSLLFRMVHSFCFFEQLLKRPVLDLQQWLEPRDFETNVLGSIPSIRNFFERPAIYFYWKMFSWISSPHSFVNKGGMTSVRSV